MRITTLLLAMFCLCTAHVQYGMEGAGLLEEMSIDESSREECFICYDEIQDIEAEQGAQALLSTNCCKHLICNRCLTNIQQLNRRTDCPYCQQPNFKTSNFADNHLRRLLTLSDQQMVNELHRLPKGYLNSLLFAMLEERFIPVVTGRLAWWFSWLQFQEREFAKHKNAVTLMQALVNAGADVNACNNGLSFLHKIVHGDLVLFLDVLLNAGVNIDATDSLGNTPAHIAALYGSTKCLRKLLITGRVDVNKKNKKGYTPAVLAANREASRDCYYILRDAGSEVDFLTGMSMAVSTLTDGGEF